MAGVLLQIKNVSKVYADEGRVVRVLDDVSFDVHEDEFVCLVGPSGCGKSTLLKMILNLDTPTSGDVLYRSRPVSEYSERISIVFQSFALLPWLTVSQNVELGLEARGLRRSERLAVVNKYLDKVGLDGFEEAYPRELSGGMKQRVGIARALAMGPELLCMDEPFSALDALTAQNLREEVLDLWEDESVPVSSVIMVTHSIDEAVFMADRVIVLSARPGRVVGDVKIDLPRPRNMKEEAFHEMTDRIYSLIV